MGVTQPNEFYNDQHQDEITYVLVHIILQIDGKRQAFEDNILSAMNGLSHLQIKLLFTVRHAILKISQ